MLHVLHMTENIYDLNYDSKALDVFELLISYIVKNYHWVTVEHKFKIVAFPALNGTQHLFMWGTSSNEFIPCWVASACLRVCRPPLCWQACNQRPTTLFAASINEDIQRVDSKCLSIRSMKLFVKWCKITLKLWCKTRIANSLAFDSASHTKMTVL